MAGLPPPPGGATLGGPAYVPLVGGAGPYPHGGTVGTVGAGTAVLAPQAGGRGAGEGELGVGFGAEHGSVVCAEDVGEVAELARRTRAKS